MSTVSRTVGGVGAAAVGKFNAEVAGVPVAGVVGEGGSDGVAFVGACARRHGKKFRVRREGEVCPRVLVDSAEVVRERDGRWLRYIADIGC